MNFKEFCEYFGHVVTSLTEALDDIQGPYKVVSPKNKTKFLVDHRCSSIRSNYNKPYVMMRNLPYQRRNY